MHTQRSRPSFLGERIAQRLSRIRAPSARVERARFRRSDRPHDRSARARRRRRATRYQNKFRYVLVDEYQDVNYAQYRLVALLAGEHKNITVVGDDDQSIYSWRGSDYRMILRFEEDFPGAKVFKLEENYRSTQTILDAANELVANNRTRAPKKLFTKRARGRADHGLSGRRPSATKRATSIEKIKELVREGAAYRDFVVLYRTNAQSRVFEEALLAEGIPYRVVGGVGFYARTEIKDMHRVPALHREPVGRAGVQAHRQRAAPRHRSADARGARARRPTPRGVSVGEAIFDRDLLRAAVPKKLKELERFAELIDELARARRSVRVADLLVAVMEESGYVRELQAEDTHDARARLENLQELVGVARELRSERRRSRRSPDFLANIALVSDLDALDRGCVVRHADDAARAKGLEFPIVFLTGLEEGVFPHSRALTDAARTGRRASPRLRRHHARDGSPLPFLRRSGARSSATPTRIRSRASSKRCPALEVARERQRSRCRVRRAAAGARSRFTRSAGAACISAHGRAIACAIPSGAKGSIESIVGAGGDGLVTIDFPNVGQKMVMLKYAPLEKI